MTTNDNKLRERINLLVTELVDPGRYEAEGIPESEYERVTDAIMQLFESTLRVQYEADYKELAEVRLDLAWCLGKLRSLGSPSEHLEEKYGME
jgi:hypothetical protein